jgi:ribulose 1,5-bisphosphate synthetase/thiazole synthase
MSTSTSGAPSVAVVGGGISGLVCATDLAAHGFKVSVFDMGKVNPGGGGLGGIMLQCARQTPTTCCRPAARRRHAATPLAAP